MLNVVLYGKNGHQISGLFPQVKNARLAGTFEFCLDGVKEYASEAELLSDQTVSLVSVCAKMRSEQGNIIERLLKGGKNVYAEKPLAMTVEEIEKLTALAKERGLFLGEMADTIFQEPYATLGELVKSGEIGEIVQAHVQKSYPYADWRPQDENVDGGLIRQNSIHAIRIIEGALGLEISDIRGYETTLGNPVKGGGLRMAASLAIRTTSGAVCSVDANYLNPPDYSFWCNESVKVFGVAGSIDVDFVTRKVTVTGGTGSRVIETEQTDSAMYFQRVVDCIEEKRERPQPLEKELHPTKVVAEVKDAINR